MTEKSPSNVDWVEDKALRQRNKISPAFNSVREIVNHGHFIIAKFPYSEEKPLNLANADFPPLIKEVLNREDDKRLENEIMEFLENKVNSSSWGFQMIPCQDGFYYLTFPVGSAVRFCEKYGINVPPEKDDKTP